MKVNGRCDPKGKAFVDKYSHYEGEDDNGPVRLNPCSTKKTNQTAALSASSHKTWLRKNYRLVVIVVAASFFLVAIFWGKRRTPVLRFRLQNNGGDRDDNYNSSPYYSSVASNQTFKIMQITDIHLGEAEYTEWGPKQDGKTFRLLDKIFEYEPDCDLIVLGGDQLTANNCFGNCTEYYAMLGRFLSGHGVPWATIMGNHDDMDFKTEDGTTIPHSYTRRDLLRVDRRFVLSLSQESTPGEQTGVTNYVLDVLDPVTEEAALQIFFLDSGGGSLRRAIEDDQIKWFREKAGVPAHTGSAEEETSEATSASKRTVLVPAVAFQHIPTWHHEYVDGNCLGYQGEGVSELEYDGGIVDAMIEARRFHFLAVGHNHGNDYCCPYDSNTDDDDDDDQKTSDLYFCFGRHSGYGGYGSWDRGVRIYELVLTIHDEYDGYRYSNYYNKVNDVKKEFKWRTWVRLESGEKVDILDVS